LHIEQVFSAIIQMKMQNAIYQIINIFKTYQIFWQRDPKIGTLQRGCNLSIMNIFLSFVFLWMNPARCRWTFLLQFMI